MNRLAIKIKEARVKAGLTEKQLAKKCGLSINYIIQIESGKKIINESIADKILNSLGAKEEFIKEEKPTEKPKAKVKSQPQEEIIVEPNQSWSSALAGVIKKYPIYEQNTNKVVGFKELPIIGKKVEGHKPDKLMFVKCSNDEMDYFRIKKDDVVTILKTADIQNYGVYMLEVKGKKMIRQAVKEANSSVKLQKSTNDTNSVKVKMTDIKVVGTIIKNEFSI